jgi:hypothetical protein
VQERYRKMHEKYREIRNEESRVNTRDPWEIWEDPGRHR